MNSEHSHKLSSVSSPRGVSARKIQASSTFLEIIEKTNCGIPNTLKGSTYKYLYFYRRRCPNDKVPVGPGFPRGSQCIPTDRDPVCRAWGPAAWTVSSCWGQEVRQRRKSRLSTGCVFIGGTWGMGLESFTFARRIPSPAPPPLTRLAFKAFQIP